MSPADELSTLGDALVDINSVLVQAEAVAAKLPPGAPRAHGLAVRDHIRELRDAIEKQIEKTAHCVASAVSSDMQELSRRPWTVTPGDTGGASVVGAAGNLVATFPHRREAHITINVINSVGALLLAIDAMRGAS